MKKLKHIGSITTIIVGLIIAIMGFYFWLHYEIGSKMFQLSNELVGAGLFIAALGVGVRLIRK